MFISKIKFSIALALFSLILYANTLQNGYVIDDGQVITNNKLVTQGIKAIPELLVTSRLKGYGPVENDSYRPMSLITFAIEHQFFGNNPVTGHFFNIFFFAGCVVLLFLFLNKLFGNSIPAFISALLFAFHPIHTEVVANIKSRDELLCFFFVFWALNTFIGYVEKGKFINLLSGMVLFFLSLLSKETVISFIVIFPIVFFFYANEQKKRSIFITGAMLVAIACFFAARFAILNTEHATDVVFMSNPLIAAPDAATRIATALLGLGMYLKLLVIPYPLICDYSYNTIPFVSFGNIYVLLALTTYLFLATIGIFRLIKKTKDPWAFSILFFLITLALFSNIPFLVYSQFAERFLFFPSAGFCLFLGFVINKWLIKPDGTVSITALLRPVALTILVPVLLAFGYLTFTRNTEWKDDFTLFSADVKKAPDNGWLCYNMGNMLITTVLDNERDVPAKKQIVEDAIGYLSNAVSVLPDHSNAHAQLCYAYTKKQMPDSAKAHGMKALELNPASVVALTSLGVLYFSTKEFPKAISCFKEALAIKPDYKIEYGNLGLCYLYTSQYDSAINYLQLSLLYTPGNKIPYGNIALAYNKMGQKDSALKYEQITKQYFPRFNLPSK